MRLQQITGQRIKKLRECLGVDPFAMAALLGVHVSTIYRWESSTHADANRLQLLLLLELDKFSAANHGEVMRALGQRVVNAIVRGGTVTALAELLRNLVTSP